MAAIMTTCIVVVFLAALFSDDAPSLGEHTAVRVPKQSDWVDHGTILKAGPSGSWDARLSGAISPSTVVKKDGMYFLYYIGADGDRGSPHDDGGPRHRALGVATSTDGIHFTKHSGNPIITHLPNHNEEEGVFSAGAALDGKGSIVLYYGAMDAGRQSSTLVDGDVRLAVSGNGLNFMDHGDVISHADRSIWGYGDELFPVGTFTANNMWYVYYIAKGKGTHWELGVAWGAGPEKLSRSRAALTRCTYIVICDSYIVGGGDPVWLGSDKLAIVIVRDFRKGLVEVRTASSSSPDKLSEPVEKYDFGGFIHLTIFQDRQTKTWFMYYWDSRGDGGIGVKTAPIRG